MKLSVIHAGMFKLDGGAMFGVVPKQMWEKLNTPEINNMCSWATRSLLIEIGERKILVDTGLGNKQNEKFRSHFEPHGDYDLHSSIINSGYHSEEITDVFLTHLHFDHVGGAMLRSDDAIIPTFANARIWSNQIHWDWASNPNPREKASFLPENIQPIKEQGLLNLVDVQRDDIEFLPGIRVRHCYGHTEAMMILFIDIPNGKTIVYCADLIPSSGHVGLPYVMAYDVRPLDTMAEKERLLNEAVENDYILFFEHDRINECASLKKNERGRIVIDQIMTLEEVLK